MRYGIVRRQRAGALESGWRSGLLVIATLLAIVAAVADFLTPPDVVFFWLVVMAPVLAATLLRPWAVAVVGLVALLMVWVMTVRHGLAGTTAQTVRLGAILGMTVLSAAFAHRLGVLESRAHRGAEKESTLAAIVHSTEDAVIMTDLDGTITTWNEGATRQYGWSAEEAIGREISLVYPPDSMDGLPETLATLRRGDGTGAFEARRVRKDGAVVDVSVSMSPVRDRHGRVVAVACIERDVTVLKRAEEQRRQIMERSALAERLESLGQLAGGVAHDFNNLLAINLNYLDFVLEQTSDPDARQDLTRARASAERARELTRQLLLFARQEPGDGDVIDLDSVIEDARALLGRTIGGHVELITRPSPQPLAIRADWGRMEQILLNLVINARDAMPDGGTVIIEAAPVELDDDPDRLPPLPAGSYAQLQVSDTGTGMTPEVAARIFEPFFTTKAKQHGTGLGLATVYAIVTESGGDISVTSEPQVGTTFRILLPTVTAGTAPPDDAATQASGSAGRRVLVAEDDPEVRRIAVRILETNGYQVSQAEHGRAALDRIHRRPFDLLITDVIMPEMSGSRLAETVRMQYPGLRILLISGYSEETARVQHLVMDGVPLIHKPFTAVELLDAVRQALGVTADAANT
ncbi:PAS/PAC sensor hybrid histidine kinase [Krasilnikovia cinnamomea]|uniref:histidine kinase n=1 Tax=Krasilnikovia cinnamomea TaxID=349313 RepID=A0A4Q7ZEU1_9ACTN|nr:PAS domain S-box protein [Krasilnikovia cinnamomea]RZU49250.1 PAS/PAC sensor hybrid histidine kinase [Krasilnikovia cinnamomea]